MFTQIVIGLVQYQTVALRPAGIFMEYVMNKEIHKYLSLAFNSVENAPLECDGFSLMLAVKLDEAGWPYKRLAGVVHDRISQRTVQPHLWIETHGLIIDYRLRMWLPNVTSLRVPNGVFSTDFALQSGFNYDGVAVSRPGISSSIIRFMSDGFSDKICLGNYINYA